MLITVTGTTLIRGGNSPTWMKRKRKRLNGKLASVTAVHWPATQFRSCVVTEVSDCHVFNSPLQSRWEEMDWKAESSFKSSEEEGGDEQNTNTSWYSLSQHTLQDEWNNKKISKNLWKQSITWCMVQEIPAEHEFYCLISTDTAYSCDPRIKKFKEEEKARKESEKKAKADAKKREQEEKERVSHSLTL